MPRLGGLNLGLLMTPWLRRAHYNRGSSLCLLRIHDDAFWGDYNPESSCMGWIGVTGFGHPVASPFIGAQRIPKIHWGSRSTLGINFSKTILYCNVLQ